MTDKTKIPARIPNETVFRLAAEAASTPGTVRRWMRDPSSIKREQARRAISDAAQKLGIVPISTDLGK